MDVFPKNQFQGDAPTSHKLNAYKQRGLILAVRRNIYLHNIVSRHNSELLFRVYSAMKNAPLKGDWINIVRKDMEEMDIKFSEI